MAVTVGATSYHVNRLGPYGPFVHGANLYVLAVDTTNYNVEVHKSSDGGATWAEQDAASAPVTSTHAGKRSAGGVVVGDTLWVVYFPSADVGFVPFNMATDTYGTKLATEFFNNTLNRLAEGPTWGVDLRNTNQLPVLARDVTSIKGTDYRRVAASVVNVSTDTAVLSRATISTPSDATHHDERGIVAGSSNRTHYFWSERTKGTLRHRTLNGDDTFGTAQTVASDVVDGHAYAAGWSARNGTTEIAIPYRDTAGNLKVARAASAVDPTWTIQTITTTTPETTNSNPAVLVYNDGVLHCFLVRDDNQNIEHVDDGGTGTWGAPEAFATTTCENVSAGVVDANTLGVLWSNGGTATFDTFTLSATGPQTVTVGVAGETEAARQVAANQAATVAVGAASEVETARPVAASLVAPVQVVPVGAAGETETAQPVAVVVGTVAVVVGTVAEVETVQPVTATAGVVAAAVGAASEFEAVQPVTTAASATVPVGVSSEVETARPVGVVQLGAPQSVAVGAAAESETVQPVTAVASTTVTVVAASEVETAGTAATATAVTVTVGGVSETDTVGTVVVSTATTVAVGAVSVTETAQPVAVSAVGATQTVTVGVGAEVETARTVAVAVADPPNLTVTVISGTASLDWDASPLLVG